MKKYPYLFVLLFLSISCSEDDPTDTRESALSEIIGLWTIDELNYRTCTMEGNVERDCVDDITDFRSSYRTFEITKDSVFIRSALHSPDLTNPLAIHAFVNDTLKLKKNDRIFNFVINEKSSATMVIGAVMPHDNLTYYNIFTLHR
ncbi:MAG TPA: hypothetical protein VD927_05920 [Chryseosolibacter sp.]|nr:hypothetical protein [Chryseosolibacter sp.]